MTLNGVTTDKTTLNMNLSGSMARDYRVSNQINSHNPSPRMVGRLRKIVYSFDLSAKSAISELSRLTSEILVSGYCDGGFLFDDVAACYEMSLSNRFQLSFKMWV